MKIGNCKIYCYNDNQKNLINVELNNQYLADIEKGVGMKPVTVIYNNEPFDCPDLLVIEDEVEYIASLLGSFELYWNLFDFVSIGVILDNSTLERVINNVSNSAPKLITMDFKLSGKIKFTNTEQARKNYHLLKSKFSNVPIIGITNFSQSDFAREFIKTMRKNYDNVWPKTMLYKVLPSLIEDRLAIQNLSNQVEGLTEELKTTHDQKDKSFLRYYFNKLPIALEHVREVKINDETPEQILTSLNLGGGQSFATKCMFYQISKSIRSDVFLVSGESGSGKDIISQILHKYSKQKGSHKKFTCSELIGADPNIAAQKLFGVEKGEFQGLEPSKGWLDEANPNGTVFLDEVHHLPLEVQAKLLDTIRNKVFYSSGGKKEKKLFNVKLVFATNRDLKIESQKVPAVMHHDFYNRINKIMIKVPSLAERDNDFDSIIISLLKKLNNRHGTTKTISVQAIKKLKSLSYENSNIEKLHTILEVAVTQCSNVNITPDWIVDLDDQTEIAVSSGLEFNPKVLEQHLNRLKNWVPKLEKIKKEVIGQQELASELNIKQAMISQDLGTKKNDNENKIRQIITQKLLSQEEVDILLKLKSFRTKYIELCKDKYIVNMD